MTHLENYGHWGLRQDCPWALSLLPYLGSDETVPGPCHCTIFRLRRNYPWALSLPPYSNFFYLKDSLSSLLEITLFFVFLKFWRLNSMVCMHGANVLNYNIPSP